MYNANRQLRHLRLYVTISLRYLLTYVVKVHCNLRVLDKIEVIGHNDLKLSGLQMKIPTDEDPLRFLAGCRTRRLNHMSVLSLA